MTARPSTSSVENRMETNFVDTIRATISLSMETRMTNGIIEVLENNMNVEIPVTPRAVCIPHRIRIAPVHTTSHASPDT
jgi:hypothetical protein